MTSPLRNIIQKEVIEIFRDPRLFLSMVLVPLLIFPMLGISMSAVISSTTEELGNMEFNLIVVDGDNGTYGQSLIQNLSGVEKMNIEIAPHGMTGEEAISSAVEREMDAVILIPNNFSSNLAQGNMSQISVYTVIRSMSIVEGSKDFYIISLLEAYEKMVIYEQIGGLNTTYHPEFFLNPIFIEENSVVEGRAVPYSPAQITGFMVGQSAIVPIILMMLIVMSAQLAAVTVASEKEEKTLETLLSLPVRRTTILMGKISGVAMMALIGAVAYMAGFLYYMNSLMGLGDASGTAIGLEELGLSMQPEGIIILALSLVLALLAALSIAVLLAAFTQDVRSAQSLTGIIVVPVIIPAFILMMGDMSVLPGAIQGLILAIPFSYPILAAQGMFSATDPIMYFGLAYQLVFALVVFYIAGRLFSTEKIFTAKLEFKRK